jgi:hypothetical protein
MKHKTTLLAILVVGVALSLIPRMALSQGNAVGNGVKYSVHDFSLESWNATDEICRVCHVPHDHNRTSQRYLSGLLWNHALSSATYTMYDSSWSSTLDGAQSAQPDGIAKLCLGCHDGTVAVDNFDKYSGTLFMSDFNPNFIIPGFSDGANRDLRGTHPVSIEYDPVADGNLNPKTDAMGTSGTIQDVLDHDKVQCSSCHDVHDQETVPGTRLLRVAQSVAEGGTPSGLCLTCHIK